MSDLTSKYARLALAMLKGGPREALADKPSYASLSLAEENKADMDIAFEPYPEETPKTHYNEAAPRTFKEAFAAARSARLKGGSDTFTWNGKKYTAYTKEDLAKKQYQKPEKREVFPLAGYSGRTMSDSQPVQSPETRRFAAAPVNPNPFGGAKTNLGNPEFTKKLTDVMGYEVPSMMLGAGGAKAAYHGAKNLLRFLGTSNKASRAFRAMGSELSGVPNYTAKAVEEIGKLGQKNKEAIEYALNWLQ